MKNEEKEKIKEIAQKSSINYQVAEREARESISKLLKSRYDIETEQNNHFIYFNIVYGEFQISFERGWILLEEADNGIMENQYWAEDTEHLIDIIDELIEEADGKGS